MSRPLIFNIQKYSIHDGDGIRTTVFFKGCPLSCLWCHNPESQHYEKEILYHQERCRGCADCEKTCPKGALKASSPAPLILCDRSLCTLCGLCAQVCVQNARQETGREYAVRDLVKELEKDRMFYEQSGGGITLSGGEALSQDMDYIEELVQTLYRKGYSVNIDTCGHVPYQNIRRVLPYTDTFLYDIKLLDSKAHSKYTGRGNELILDNLKRLSEDGGRIHIRLPLIAGVNADETHLKDTIAFLKDNHIHVWRLNLLPYHNTGSAKYRKLYRDCDNTSFAAPDREWLQQTAALFIQHGFPNTIIGG